MKKVEMDELEELLATTSPPKFNHKPCGPSLEDLEKESAYLQLFKTLNNGHENKKEMIRI